MNYPFQISISLSKKMGNDGVISGAKLLMMCLAQCLTYECSTYKYNSCAAAGGVGRTVVKFYLHGEH